MAISLDKPKLDNLAGDIWKSAARLRGKLKAYEYQSVILPEFWKLEKEAEKMLEGLAQ
jgi:hypothetical protein